MNYTDPKELVTIVDKNDKILKFLPRSEAHKKNIMHRTISILIYNSKGQLILQKRSKNKDTYPGFYTNGAGGHVAKGESYEQTALRELREELNLDIKPTLIKKMIVDDPIHKTMTSVYKIIYDGEFKINLQEIERIDKFDLNDLAAKTDQIANNALIILRDLKIL